MKNKRTSLRGACDEAISYNKEQIATLSLAMTAAYGRNVGADLRVCPSVSPNI
ncbi:MAG: hypothetical protein ACK5MG_04620 [Bacteroidales bacterium]